MYSFLEDSKRDNLRPLVTAKPTDLLRLGMLTIKEKWEHSLSSTFYRRCPEPLNVVFDQSEPASTTTVMYVNPRVLPTSGLALEIKKLPLNSRLVFNETVIAVHSTPIENYSFIDELSYETEHSSELAPSVLSACWDIFSFNGKEIEHDFQRMELKDNRSDSRDAIHLTIYGEHPVYIHPNAEIEPNCTIISTYGPVYIGPDTIILAGNHLRGSLAICEKAIIKVGSHVYGNTTIGPGCKIGGEVNNVVFQANSNKSHDGYLGNAVVGEWCNLGADTNCSNLKNNYSYVKAAQFPEGNMVNTGLQFCGAIIGDHTKTAINTMINTGSVFGLSCNVATGDFPPKFLPDFAWLTTKNQVHYEFERAIDTMREVMRRRNKVLTGEEIKMMRDLWEASVLKV